MPRPSIDFSELKRSLDLRAVLAHYRVELKGSGGQLSGFCPLPTHQGKGAIGKKRSPSFSANADKKIWQCFGCGAKGNILELAVRLEGHDPSDTKALRSVAEKLAELFGTKTAPTEQPVTTVTSGATEDRQAADSPKGDSQHGPVIVNPPISITLKLDPEHPYLAERGLTRETVDHFGLGYCSRGMMAGRIAIPIHDASGELIAYAGRLVDDNAIDETHPKYRFPPGRKVGDEFHDFQKSQVLYNGHQIEEGAGYIIVLEGFPSVWHLWQAGISSVVAVMGSSMSEAQAAQLSARAPKARIVVMPDGDRGGQLMAESALTLLAGRHWVTWWHLEAGQQPTDLSPERLKERLSELFAA